MKALDNSTNFLISINWIVYMKKTILTEIIFWLHLPIVVVWFGLFFVPKSAWPEKVFFHFWYIIGIMLVQYLWGILIFRKTDIICPLTTLMQYLRGYSLKDKRNYSHSYIAELLEKMHITSITYRQINVILLITLIIVAVQYFWFR